MTDSRKPRLIAGTALIDAKPGKPGKVGALKQRREIEAWRKQAQRKDTD